jgi:beta-ureidopropionase / N-carbamoyl-L-amino-acid hydrolase
MAVDPERTIAAMRELHELTGSAAGGAQRLAWGEGVGRAREWLDEKLAELPVEVTYDAAGNHWATLRGASERALVVGSHLDSVAGGGWLDGALGVLSGLEALRAISERYDGRPPVTVRLVDWADEEGARFGRSLLGSSAAAGTLDIDELRGRVDSDGVAIEDAMAAAGVDIERLKDSGAELESMAAYLELHIEQGPVLEQERRLALAAVDGTCAAKRYRVRFEGEACHPAATPMSYRRDALLACSRFVVGAHEIAERHEAMTSIGYVGAEPNHITIIAGACETVIEQNHRDGEVLDRVVAETQALARELAAEGSFELSIEPLWETPTIHFDPELTALGEARIAALGEEPFRMTSGPLHDAAEMARAGIPATMLFVRSIGGISHNPAENTDPADLVLAIRALAGLADDALDLVAAGAAADTAGAAGPNAGGSA